MTRMRRCLALVVLLTGGLPVPLLAAPQSSEESPFSGTWVANIAKSKRHPNHQFQSATMEFAVVGNTVTLKHGGVNAGGQQESATIVLEADGKEHPIPQAPGVTVVTRWVGPRVLQSIGKSAGAQVGEQTYRQAAAGGSTLVRGPRRGEAIHEVQAISGLRAIRFAPPPPTGCGRAWPDGVGRGPWRGRARPCGRGKFGRPA